MKDFWFNIYIGIIIVVAVIAVGIAIYRPINKVSNMRTEVVTVTDKGTKRYQKSDRYMIYGKKVDTDEVVVYEITDSWLAGRFDSSDTFASIEVEKTYEFKIGGSRNHLLSWYPNIYEYKEVIK